MVADNSALYKNILTHCTVLIFVYMKIVSVSLVFFGIKQSHDSKFKLDFECEKLPGVAENCLYSTGGYICQGALWLTQ